MRYFPRLRRGFAGAIRPGRIERQKKTVIVWHFSGGTACGVWKRAASRFDQSSYIFIDIPAPNHYTQGYDKSDFGGFCGCAAYQIVFV
jgi:hypothetical protein